jgi:hypothetical protein
MSSAFADICTIFLELLKGRRPSTELLKRYGVVLIVALTVPTIISDTVKLRSKRSEEDQKLTDKLRKKFNGRLKEMVDSYRFHLQQKPATELASASLKLLDDQEPGEEDDEGEGKPSGSSQGTELKAAYVVDCLGKVTNYDADSPLVVKGYLVWANVLECELEEAHKKTCPGGGRIPRRPSVGKPCLASTRCSIRTWEII